MSTQHTRYGINTEKPKWVIWAIVGQYTDKMTQKYVKNESFCPCSDPLWLKWVKWLILGFSVNWFISDWNKSCLKWNKMKRGYIFCPGGSHIDTVYVLGLCACLLGRFFAKFGIAIRGFHQRRRSPNYINWMYFGQIIVKITQFGQNWVLFFWKWYTGGWEIRQKIFEIRQAHPRTILVPRRFWFNNLKT